ncbi:hypothetical protein [Argonema galeatum]|uniref:hypothetical protein n=1 Tax=Argonema galeatum TaxID=2942762 RepID=UPI002011C987|nr:hypothetical protein [Argonema galeatum]MCL1466603.1 hypothetical protein [Argonema galeatum A003/A1]
MDSLNLRTKVITEINLVPPDKLEELYNLIHYFRLGVESSKVSLNQTMQFAGCWNDMSDEIFANFNEEISTRRQQAFLGRRSDEASFD